MRGFAPAMRVMSRSEPPACASGSWPSTRAAPAWFDDDVREHVRHVARQRDEPVVRVGSIATGVAPSVGDEAVHEAVALGVGLRDRRQEPGRALEEPGARVLGAARLGAADRVAADEARRAGGRRDDARLRRADVGDGRRVAGRLEHRGDLRGQLRDRRRDDGEVGAARRASSSDGAGRRRAPRSTAAASACGVGVPADDVAPPRALRGERRPRRRSARCRSTVSRP